MRLGEKVAAMETWLLLELCNHGTLSYAIERGKFDKGFLQQGRRSRQPHLPFIKSISPPAVDMRANISTLLLTSPPSAHNRVHESINVLDRIVNFNTTSINTHLIFA